MSEVTVSEATAEEARAIAAQEIRSALADPAHASVHLESALMWLGESRSSVAAECGCCYCDELRRVNQRIAGGSFSAFLGASRMIVCPDCGNKRCPKAAHHDNACTNSNDVGQVGSRY